LLARFVMPPVDLALLLAGAFAGAFVSGVSGFAFGLVTLTVWVWLLPLPELTPLVLFGSLAAQVMAIRHVLPHADWRLLRPMLVAAAIGVPAGVMTIALVDLAVFRIAFGALLIGFCLFQLAVGTRWHVPDLGRWAEFLVGLIGGALGGLSGLSGVLPVVWGLLRRWDMQQHRAVLTLFNTTCHILGLAGMIIGGLITTTTLVRFGLMTPCLVAGAWLGVRAWRYVSPQGFRRLVLWLLLASGTILIARGLLLGVAA
jgi:uncharacterized membrane protein YfcA